MFPASVVKGMSRGGLCAAKRTKAIAQHMMSTAASASEPSVKFESNRALRTYILNRPSKLNALDESMLSLLRPKIEEWSSSDLCGTVLGTGVGRAFCAGGDIASVVQNASDPSSRHQAVDFFKREFEMDYILAALSKPYVVLLDGFTMGGGVGLAAHAPFRIATENTTFAMPETKIGYCPDVGASYFLSRLDGELGTYFALTSDIIRGRAVFEHGFATHFIPARRIPVLMERLAALEDAHPKVIDQAIEELVSEREPSEAPLAMSGRVREALDFAFRHGTVEGIFEDLGRLSKHPDSQVSQWAKQTLETLEFRSPTSLKVALRAIRQGRAMTLLEALNMELKIATAYCNGASPDFPTGVNAVLGEGKKNKERPKWSPSTVDGVTREVVSRFFEDSSRYLSDVPVLDIPEELTKKTLSQPMKFGLPTEEEIGTVVRGAHKIRGPMGLTLDELVGAFADLRPGKVGVKEKIVEVASRRCEVVDNADGNFVWLKWKPTPTGGE